MVLERLADVPGLAELRALATRPAGGRLWLVGGSVRDALLGEPVRDLDVVVEGDAIAVARALGEVVGRHERFGTAEVLIGGRRVNLAAARTERYPAPGALPEVTLGASIGEDLRRRDFTVNAIAVALDDGREVAVAGAREDLAARRLRVLHDRSFADDPTRLYRMARYVARLSLEVEPHTARLARAAAAAPLTVSRDRVRQELRLMLAEPDPVTALVAAREWAGGLAPHVEPELARDALELLPGDGRADVVLAASGPIAVALQLAQAAAEAPPPAPDALGAGFLVVERAAPWSQRRAAARPLWPQVDQALAGSEARRGMALLDDSRAARRRAGEAARAPGLAAALEAAGDRPSAIAAAVRGRPVEAVALAGALGAERAARRWLDELRGVRLAIDGRDVIAAGVPEGPAVGRALERALAARLDGTIGPGSEAELRAALGA